MEINTIRTTDKQAISRHLPSQEARKVLSLLKKAVVKEAVSSEIKVLQAVQAVSLEAK